MGFMNDLYQLMRESTPAMEADDITEDVSNTTSNLAGDKKKDNSGEISTNTNDILGIKEDTDDETSDTDEPKENEADLSKDNEEEMEETPSEDGEDENLPTEDETNDAMKEKESPFEASRKKKIWENFRSFHNTLNDSIDLISKYVPNTSDSQTIKTLGDIRENLMEAKQMVFRTITEDYKSMSYPELENRYTGLNQIYDLISKELETYFKKYRENG